MEDWIKEYWIKALFGALVGAFTLFMNWVRKKFREQECLKTGVQALLRNEIIQQYNYWMEKGYCPIYARENIKNMYDKYHNLGQNGIMTDLVEKIFDLPTEKEKRL